MKKFSHRLVLVVTSAIALLLCTAQVSSREMSDIEYVGNFTCCFESGTFVPCPNPNSEIWFVTEAPPQFWKAVHALPQSDGNFDVFTGVKARLGRKGHYGHRAVASREMTIIEVLELRARRKEDGQCYPPPPFVPPP